MLKKNVLIVDDHRIYPDCIATLFERAGWQPWVSRDISLAFDFLNTHHVHLLISDFKMPEMNGLEFVERVRESHPHLPTIFLSASTEEIDPNKVQMLGVHSVVDKLSLIKSSDLLSLIELAEEAVCDRFPQFSSSFPLSDNKKRMVVTDRVMRNYCSAVGALGFVPIP
ncbi:MAG: response regulator [Verrucomicrobiota bacterium]